MICHLISLFNWQAFKLQYPIIYIWKMSKNIIGINMSHNCLTFFSADIGMSHYSFLEARHRFNIYPDGVIIGVKICCGLTLQFLGLLAPSFSHLLLISAARPDAVSSVPALPLAQIICPLLRWCSRRPIIPLCNTQENAPPPPIPPTVTAQVHKPKRKQTPISNLSVKRKGCRAHLHPLPPPTPPPPLIYPFSPFSSACLLCAPQPNHRRPLHSYDLLPGMPPKPNRSGLQQGGPPGRQERDRGCVNGGYKDRDGQGIKKNTYDEVLCNAQKKQQQH